MGKMATAILANDIVARMEKKNQTLHDAAVSKGIDLQALAESIMDLPSNAKKGPGRLTSQLIQRVKEEFLDHVANVVLIGNQDRLDSPIPIKVHMMTEDGQIFEANTWGLSTKIDGAVGVPITFPSLAKDVILEKNKDARYDNYSLIALNGYKPTEIEKVLPLLAKRTMDLEQLRKIALTASGEPTYRPVVFSARIKDIRAIPSGWSNPSDEERAAGATSAPEGYYPLVVEDLRKPPQPHPCFTANAKLGGSSNVTANLRISAPKYSAPWIVFEEPLVEINDNGIACGGMVVDAVKDSSDSENPEIRAAELMTDDIVDTPVIVVGTIVNWKVGNNDMETISVSVSAMLETQTLIPPGGGSVQAGLKSFEIPTSDEKPPRKQPSKKIAPPAPIETNEPDEEISDEDEVALASTPAEDTENLADEIVEAVVAEPPAAAPPVGKSAKSVFHRGEDDSREKQVIKAINSVMVATKKFITDIPDDALFVAVKSSVPDATMEDIALAKEHFLGKAK